MIPILISFAVAVVALTIYFLFIYVVGWVLDRYLEITLDPGAIVLIILLVTAATFFVHALLF